MAVGWAVRSGFFPGAYSYGFVFNMDVGLVDVIVVPWWCWLILCNGFGGCGLKRGRRRREKKIIIN